MWENPALAPKVRPARGGTRELSSVKVSIFSSKREQTPSAEWEDMPLTRRKCQRRLRKDCSPTERNKNASNPSHTVWKWAKDLNTHPTEEDTRRWVSLRQILHAICHQRSANCTSSGSLLHTCQDGQNPGHWQVDAAGDLERQRPKQSALRKISVVSYKPKAIQNKQTNKNIPVPNQTEMKLRLLFHLTQQTHPH